MAYGKKPKDDNENKGRGRKGPKPIKGARKAARKQKRQEKKGIKDFKKAVNRINKQQSYDPSNPPSREGVILDKEPTRRSQKRFEKIINKSSKQQPSDRFNPEDHGFEKSSTQEMMKAFMKNMPMKQPPVKSKPALKAPGMKAMESQDDFKPSERDKMHATDFGKRSVNKNPSMKVIGKELAAGAKIASDKIKKEKGMSTTDKGIMSRYGGAEAASVTRRKGGGMVRPPRRQVKRK